MTGPDHFREGADLLRISQGRWRSARDDGEVEMATYEALVAVGHFLAALTASHATAHHPESVGWDHAINPKE